MEKKVLIVVLALITGLAIIGGVWASSNSPAGVFRGTITRVDSANKEIVVQNSEGAMTFQWTNETQFSGFPGEKAGLGSKTLKEGMKVAVQYGEGDQNKVAKRIEVTMSNLNTLKGESFPFECGVKVC